MPERKGKCPDGKGRKEMGVGKEVGEAVICYNMWEKECFYKSNKILK